MVVYTVPGKTLYSGTHLNNLQKLPFPFSNLWLKQEHTIQVNNRVRTNGKDATREGSHSRLLRLLCVACLPHSSCHVAIVTSRRLNECCPHIAFAGLKHCRHMHPNQCQIFHCICLWDDSFFTWCLKKLVYFAVVFWQIRTCRMCWCETLRTSMKWKENRIIYSWKNRIIYVK